ncbi:MAG: putative sugar nucleotidyl transferase, partial [Bacteroidota bacterium]
MGVIMYDFPGVREHLLPYTYVRPVGEIRIGILTIVEKWEKFFGHPIGYHISNPVLAAKFGDTVPFSGDLLINGALCPDPSVYQAISNLQPGEALYSKDQIIACRLAESGNYDHSRQLKTVYYEQDICLLQRPWDIFLHNGQQIRSDFKLVTAGRQSAGISDPHTIIYGSENVFVEPGATVRAAVINATDGPVYLDKNSTVHEGCLIKGPFVLGKFSQLNMGAKMKGDN